MHYQSITILLLKFDLNYTWNLIHKVCKEAFFLFLENTLLSLLRLIFFKRNLFRIGPLMTLISFSNLIRTGLLMALEIFLFLKYLKLRNANCFSYLLGKYSEHKTIIICWLGEIYSPPSVKLSLTLSTYSRDSN